MVKLFQRDRLIQGVLILVLLVLLWIRPMIEPSAMLRGEHPAVLYALLCDLLAGQARLAVIVAMLLSLAEGVMLNVLLTSVGLVPQNSLLPTFLFVLATGASATTLTPTLLVAGCMMGCLHFLMVRGTQLALSTHRVCAATTLIGLATLFHQPAICFLLTYLVVAANFRLYGWRDWMLMLLGLFAPYVLLLAVLYLNGSTPHWWDETLASLSGFGFDMGHASPLHIVCTTLMGLLFLYALAHWLAHRSERPLLWRANASTTLLMTLGGLGMCLFAPVLPFSMACIAIPFAFALSRWLHSFQSNSNSYSLRRNRTWPADVALLLLIVAAVLC